MILNRIKICKFEIMRFVILIFALLISSLSHAQDDGYVYGDNTTTPSPTSQRNSGFDWERVTVGGGFGLTFGDITVVEVAPTFGYFLTENWLAGVGLNYRYYSEKRINFSTSWYGGALYTQYLFETLPVIAHAELEVLNIENFDGTRLNIINPYVGGGIKQRIGGNSFFYILVLWNLNETRESYFLQPNPIIRGGVAIGL